MSAQKFARGPAMRDVAAAAGVSAQTVSRVLNDHPNVQESTRRRVLSVIEELGYRRNNTARALVTGRSKTIGLLTLSTNNYSRSSLALGVELGAREAGYTVNSVTSSFTTQGLTDAASRLVYQGVDGIVIAAPLHDAAREVARITARIPTISTGGSSMAEEPQIGVDQALSAALATEHLLDLGHKTVWYVSGPQEWSDAASRLASWRRTLQDAGCEVPPELHGDWSPESGYQRGLMLAKLPEVTAILVASDEMAFGVLRALNEAGRRVPDDVSVVGIDDIDLAAFSHPPLTTVSQAFENTGRRAVQHLVEQIAHPELNCTAEVVAPELVVRASTAPPPSAP